MMLHAHVPVSFSDSIIVLIIKDKSGNISDKIIYRPIALTTVVSRILKKVFLARLKEIFFTTDCQFSFKPKHSTDMCVFILKNVIDYYESLSSPVYICYMDASKAFDNVNL